MALSNAELIEAIEQKPLIEIVDLVKEMEDKWGVSAAAVAAMPAGPDGRRSRGRGRRRADRVRRGHEQLRREEGRRDARWCARSRASA